MSKILSLKLRDDVYEETEVITEKLHVPRNGYINAAIAFYNKLKKRALLKKELARESQMVRDNSMEVLKAFDAFEDELAES
ncbi:MAG: hypothetical protein A3G87_07065 [Omnitrophica bacterium RIFCSPLOWO2_12_FULL_50_11]|nr:MAG: hypothetical protein A3G87_07065 [Omnitrophica bacterium RIFCSPLOWO2_12_FULL_50_11]